MGYPYIPSVLTVKPNNKLLNYIDSEFGFPVVVKKIDMDRGEGVSKSDSRSDLLSNLKSNTALVLIQKFIKNNGDYRIITLKNKVQLVVKRQRTNEDDFRNNLAVGGSKAYKATLPDEIINMCEDISTKLNCDIVGFDIIQDENDGKYYVMEANASPHFTTFSIVSGVNLPDIIVNYILENMK